MPHRPDNCVYCRKGRQVAAERKLVAARRRGQRYGKRRAAQLKRERASDRRKMRKRKTLFGFKIG